MRKRLLRTAAFWIGAIALVLTVPEFALSQPPSHAAAERAVETRLVEVERRARKFRALIEDSARKTAALPDVAPALAGDRPALSRLFLQLEALREKTPERPMLSVRAFPPSTIAWAGRIAEARLPDGLLTHRDVFVLTGGITTSLVASVPVFAPDGRAVGVATAELPVAVRRNIRNAYLNDADRLADGQPGVEIRYLDARTGATMPRPFDRLPDGVASAGTLLRAADGDVLASVRVTATDTSPTDPRPLPRRVLCAVLLGAILLWAAAGGRGVSKPLRIMVAVTAARLTMAGLGIPLPEPLFGLLSTEVFSSPLLGSFTATPLDLLLTTLWLAVLAFATLRAALRFNHGRSAVPVVPAATWGLGLAGLPILAASFSWIAEIDGHCALNLHAFSPLPREILPATMHVSLMLVLAAGLALLTALLCLAGLFPRDARGLAIRLGGLALIGLAVHRLWPRQVIGLPLAPAVILFATAVVLAGIRDRWLPLLSRSRVGSRAAAFVIVPVFLNLLLFPSLAHFAEKSLRHQIEGRYADLVLQQPAWRERVLADTRSRIDQMKLLGAGETPGFPPSAEELAFTVWSSTEMASYGLSSAVEIQDSSGQVVSRFALNLPSVSTPLQPLPPRSRWETTRELLRIAGTGGRVLHSQRLFTNTRGVGGAVHVYLREDYWHLPFVRARDPYSVLYRPSLDSLGREPTLSLVVFDPRRSPVFSSAERPPVIEHSLIARSEATPRGFWTTLTIEGQAEHTFVFRDAVNLYLLGYARTRVGSFAGDLVEAAAEMAALAIGILLVTILLRTVLGMSPLSFPALLRATSERFTLRLYLALVLVAFAPLLVMQTVVRGFVVDRLRKEAETEALQTAAVAKKAVEDYVLFQGEETSAVRPGLDAGLVYIASLMRNDLDVFVHGRLLASSKRELYASGLIPSRLSSDAYRALVLDGQPALLALERIGGFSYLVVSVPLRLGSTEPAVLSIPLALRQREMESVLQDLDRTLRLVFVVFLACAALLAHSLARRFSDPIRALTAATKRIAGGDLSARVAPKRHDELSELVDSFNRMAGDLDRQRRDLEHSNRLAAWAEMARQVAHEVKNPLTPIQLSAEHLSRVYTDGDPDFASTLKTCTETILRQVRTLRGIVTEFSAFARPPASPLVPEDAAAIAVEAVSPYRAGLPSGVQLVVSASPGLPPVLADRRLLERAIVNLVENALHAVGEAGSVSIRLRAVPARVEIEVEDDGPGIDPEVRGRVFEPFFSTKTGGSGLGLALVKKIAEDHGGGVAFDSGPGRTRVLIWLPAAPVQVPQDPPD